MRKIGLLISSLLFVISASAQNYENGKLWLRTIEPTAIPQFDNEGHITSALPQQIETIFQNNNVNGFEKAFPLAEQINPNTDLKNCYVIPRHCEWNIVERSNPLTTMRLLRKLVMTFTIPSKSSI